MKIKECRKVWGAGNPRHWNHFPKQLNIGVNFRCSVCMYPCVDVCVRGREHCIYVAWCGARGRPLLSFLLRCRLLFFSQTSGSCWFGLVIRETWGPPASDCLGLQTLCPAFEESPGMLTQQGLWDWTISLAQLLIYFILNTLLSIVQNLLCLCLALTTVSLSLTVLLRQSFWQSLGIKT